MASLWYAVDVNEVLADPQIVDKIASKHGLTWREVEEAVSNEDGRWRRGRGGMYVVFSRTSAGRYVSAVVARDADEPGAWWVVTARNMTDTERRGYREG